MTDSIGWHERYDDPDSSVARRLVVVQRRIAEVLDALAPLGEQRVLSLCAGTGRDLIEVLRRRPDGPEPRSRRMQV
jgi:hypothetical protein